MDEPEKKHHFLIAGNVVFVNNKTEQPGSVPLNGVLITDVVDLPARSLGKAQQILQLNFFKNSRIGADEVQVVDVILMSFTYLGQFTEAEFKQPPAGMSVQQVAAELDSSLAEAKGEQLQGANDGGIVSETSAGL